MQNMLSWSLDDLIEDSDIDYEASIAMNPNDVDVWHLYIAHRMSRPSQHKYFILDRAVKQFPASVDFWALYLDLVTEDSLLLLYPADRSLLYAVSRLFSRALAIHFNNDALWIQYLQFVRSKLNPLITFTRRTFNRCLASLDTSKHKLVWPLYMDFAKLVGGITGSLIIRKYLQFADPEYLQLEHSNGELPNIVGLIELLISFGDFITAMKLQRNILSSLESYTSLNKAPFDTAMEYVKLVSRIASDEAVFEDAVAFVLDIFPDQCASVYLVALDQYKDLQQKARHFMHKALRSCTMVSDFVTIFDGFAKYEEQKLEHLAIQSEHAGTEDAERRLECAMIQFECLIDSRPLLLNDMLLRQDIHNLDAWFSRLKLLESSTEKLLQTYVAALSTVNPFKAHSLSGNKDHHLSQLWINYAAVYSNVGDFKTAVVIFQKATELQFAHSDDLARIYCAWSETLLTSGNETEAVEIVHRVLLGTNVQSGAQYEDKKMPASQRISKNAKLWSFYVDLVESLVDTDDLEKCAPHEINRVAAAYDELLNSKVATGQHILNYANFLYENKYFEESFRIFDRGLSLFTDPEILLQLWIAYLPAAMKRIKNAERMRDLFDQCLFGLNHLPPLVAQNIVEMYHDYEHSQNAVGFARNVLIKETSLIRDQLDSLHNLDVEKLLEIKLNLYVKLCHYTIVNSKDDRLIRSTFEDTLADGQLTKLHVIAIALKYIEFEESKSQFERVRALFAYAGCLGNPDLPPMQRLWIQWEQFELKHGNENSYKKMLRAKRTASTEHENSEAEKLAANPLGFVKESTKPQEVLEAQLNPAQIELDMDM